MVELYWNNASASDFFFSLNFFWFGLVYLQRRLPYVSPMYTVCYLKFFFLNYLIMDTASTQKNMFILLTILRLNMEAFFLLQDFFSVQGHPLL